MDHLRLYIAGSALAVLLLAACGGAEPSGPAETPEDRGAAPAFLNANTDVAYVGDEACFSCHEEIYRGFQEHGMARSLYRLTPENAVEDFSGVTLQHPGTGFYYTMYQQDGRFFQEEYRMDSAGRKTHRLVREMIYVVGSGTAARTYLTENEGRLYEMPVTWYTQARRWDFSPGYDLGNKRFDRLVPDRCMVCHDSYPASVPFTEGKYTEIPEGIGCERCHGPGELHVEARLADTSPPDAVDSTIVNPAHLPLGLRLDVCQQCHLHTTVSLLRAGRTPYDFRPSQPLAEYLALFSVDVPANSEEIDVISHADRMQQSACFLETQGLDNPLDCVTCHNPHEGFRKQGASYFNTTCLSCHPAAGLQARFADAGVQRDHTASSNCISCHMPKVKADGAPHSSFTDHWVRVVERDAAPGPVAVHTKTALEPYFSRDQAGPEAAVYAGMAYVVYGRQSGNRADLEEGVTRLRQALEAYPEHGEGQFILGFALQQLGRIEESIPPLEEAVRLGADVPERLNALALAYEAAGRDPNVISRLYQRALSIQPDLAEVRVNYGRFLDAHGRLDEAVAAYRQAADEQPWLATAHYNLGTAYLRQGDVEAAERALQQALSLNPVYPEALGNLGLLYASQGHMDKARATFEEAVEVAPDNPVALGNLGTFYLNNNEEAAAIPVLTHAVEVDARYVDALANLALAHLRLGNEGEARRYAQQALEVDPAHALARQILSTL